jgi:polyisoprenoid-binding protein YceI
VDPAPAMRPLAALALAAVVLCTLTGAALSPWTVDRQASRIELSVEAFGGARSGHFNDWNGDIVFDPADPQRTRAMIVVRSGSVEMSPALATRRATGPGFLDAAHHPLIRFDLRTLEPLGGEHYTARAQVTMKGVTRPVAFPVDLRLTGDRAHLRGAFDLNRADFGIGTTGPWNRLVGRQVTVRVALQAQRG